LGHVVRVPISMSPSGPSTRERCNLLRELAAVQRRRPAKQLRVVAESALVRGDGQNLCTQRVELDRRPMRLRATVSGSARQPLAADPGKGA
jgi:hypothetical protein